MGLRIRTNVASLTAQRALSSSRTDLNKSLERLSSGYRINKAADDAAGLAISENLRADVRGLNQAKRNANDGVSLVQTAEGGLNEVANVLIRLRELAIQGASDTIGNTERGFLNKEYLALKDEIDRITLNTEFNGTRLLVGDQGDIDESLVGASNQFPLEVQVGKDYFPDVDSMDQRNPINIIRIDLQKLNTQTESGLGIGQSDNDDGTNVASKEGSQSAISKIDSAMTLVSGFRAELGAIQNRFGSTIRNLSISVENISAAKSRIKDADFAEETAKMTQSQILQQAGISVLAQANQNSQVALSLLG